MMSRREAAASGLKMSCRSPGNVIVASGKDARHRVEIHTDSRSSVRDHRKCDRGGFERSAVGVFGPWLISVSAAGADCIPRVTWRCRHGSSGRT